MSLFKQVSRLQKFDYYVRHQVTGPSTTISKRLNLSRSSFYDFLEEVKLLGAPIAYDKQRKTYYYEEPWSLLIGMKDKKVDEVETANQD